MYYSQNWNWEHKSQHPLQRQKHFIYTSINLPCTPELSIWLGKVQVQSSQSSLALLDSPRDLTWSAPPQLAFNIFLYNKLFHKKNNKIKKSKVRYSSRTSYAWECQSFCSSGGRVSNFVSETTYSTPVTSITKTTKKIKNKNKKHTWVMWN